MSTPTQQLRFAFAGPGVITETAADRETMRFLERLARRHTEVWAPTKSIAAAFGITVRAAQLRLKRLIALGLVERVYDYSLRSRRALVLLWRRATTYGDCPPPPNCAESAQHSALIPGSPPIRSELNLKREIEIPHRQKADLPTTERELTTTNFEPVSYETEGPTGRALLSAGVPPEVLHAPPGPATLAEALAPLEPRVTATAKAADPEPPGDQRKATPDEVARTVARVRKLFPQLPDPNRFVRTLAMRLRLNGDRVGIGWVSDAVDWAEHKGARSPFYLTTAVEDWVANGYPGKPPAPRAPIQQNYNPLAAPEPEAPPTPDELASLERLASGHGPAARMARLHLERARQESARKGVTP